MTFDRRAFLKSVSAGTVGAGALSPILMSGTASAASPSLQQSLQTGESPVFKLGLAAYSFKPHFEFYNCLLYTSPSPRDATLSRMPSSA